MPINICCTQYYKGKCHRPLAPKKWPALSPSCLEEFPHSDPRIVQDCRIRVPIEKLTQLPLAPPPRKP